MAEITEEMRTVQVDYTCDKCGIGKMRNNGVRYPMSPPLYPHVCNNEHCDHSENFWCTYPDIRVVPITTINEKK